jgi:hypothetical protein
MEDGILPLCRETPEVSASNFRDVEQPLLMAHLTVTLYAYGEREREKVQSYSHMSKYDVIALPLSGSMGLDQRKLQGKYG